MKINKLILGFVAMVSLLLTGCSSDDDYKWETVEGNQVYFSNELASKLDLDKNNSGLLIPINRVVTDEAITVKLTLTDESGAFSIPSEVSFAKGQDKQNIQLTYDASKLDFDDYKDLKISIANAEYTTPYGISSYEFSAGLPAPYNTIGTGTLTDQFCGYEVEVEIKQSIDNPNVFRIMHPYDEIAEGLTEEGCTPYVSTLPEFVEITVLQPGNVLGGNTVTQQDLVYYAPFSIGVDLFDLNGPTSIIHPVHLGRGENGWLNNCVTGWQPNGLPGQISIAPIFIEMESMRGSDQSGSLGIITITFPGYNPKDYSVDVNYVGAFLDKTQQSFALANVTLGADVKEVKVAVVEGDNADNALNAVLSGTVETISVTESGEVKVPCSYSGACTLMAVSYADGEPQDYAYDTFNFALSAGKWKSLGNGLYTDYAFAPWFLGDADGNPAPAPTYAVEVQESTETPGVYRVINPYHPDNYYYSVEGLEFVDNSDYHIVIDAHDPDAAFIQTQPIGIDGGYLDQAETELCGTITLFTSGGKYIDAGYSFDQVKAAGLINGTLRNGVITFAPKELVWGGTLTDKGWYCGIEDLTAEKLNFLPTEVLVLPQAVTAAAKAKAKASQKRYGKMFKSLHKYNAKMTVSRRAMKVKETKLGMKRFVIKNVTIE